MLQLLLVLFTATTVTTAIITAAATTITTTAAATVSTSYVTSTVRTNKMAATIAFSTTTPQTDTLSGSLFISGANSSVPWSSCWPQNHRNTVKTPTFSQVQLCQSSFHTLEKRGKGSRISSWLQEDQATVADTPFRCSQLETSSATHTLGRKKPTESCRSQ